MDNANVLEIRKVSKSFPGVKALNSVDLELKKGEVLGILGENGAGKSTLIKILSGVYRKDSGEIYIEGEKIEIDSPDKAKKLGVRVIYQELNIMEHLSVIENIFLGELPTKKIIPIVDWKKIKSEGIKILTKLNINIDPDLTGADLTVAQRQLIEIARAVAKKSKILIMDEPSAALGDEEVTMLFQIINELKKSGVSIIYITHKIGEIFKITDRVCVLRDGEKVGVCETREVDQDKLVFMMVGRKIEEMYPKTEITLGENVLEVNGFNRGRYFKDISFNLRKGEILAIFGLVGSGRRRLIMSLFGAAPKDSGELRLYGKKINIKEPSDSRNSLIGLVPADRKRQGLCLSLSVANNLTLSNIKDLGTNVFISKKIEKEKAEKFVKDLNIKTPSIYTICGSLSGGNQQKVVIAKWLESGSNILILDEPTRGIDVGSKVEIYKIMEDLCLKGNSIIMLSSELPEVLGVADRIIVMNKGRIISEYLRNKVDKQKILKDAGQ